MSVFTLTEARALVEDPDMRTTGGFIIRRPTVTVDDDGIVVRSNVDIPAEGVVVPNSPLGVTFMPSHEAQGDGILVFTTTPISTGDASTGQQADEIIWRDLVWQVVGQDDWADHNFNTAEAVLQDRGGRGA